nr:universal stress protein A-like protein [Ipomoea batatas]
MEKTISESSAYACPGEAMHAQVPTTVKETTATRTWKVMVAIDDSGESFYALKWAIDYLLRRNYPSAADAADETPAGAMVTLVNVQPTFRPLIYPPGPDPVELTPMVVEAVKKGQEHNASEVLSRALQICRENKVRAETLILEGDAKDRICEAAEEMHVDLLVVGSRGLGKIKRAFLGSVSDYCAHHVHCPILIVKPPSNL